MADEQQNPVQFALGLLTEWLPIPKLPPAIEALLPYLQELAMSEQVLTDQRRADIAAAILQTLRRIGLKGVDIE